MRAERWPTKLRNPTAESRYLPRPRQIGIEITGRCQLRCRHCFNDSGPERTQELPLPIIERVLNEISSWGVDHVRITGGEPTFHHDFESVLSACKTRGIRVVLNSHGVYSAKRLAWLLHAPVERFIISLDGLLKNHEMVCGHGTFERAVNSCRELRRADKPVTIAFHAGRHNHQDVAGLIRLAAELQVDFKLSPVRPVGRVMRELPNTLLTPVEYLSVVREIVRSRRKYRQIHIFTDFDILGESADSCAITDVNSACGAGRSLVSIACTGDIYPCAFFTTANRNFSAGNVYRDSLAEVWKSSPILEPFRIHTKSAICRQCHFYRHRCAGGCPAVAHFTRGALDAHDPMCFAALLESADEVARS